MTDNKRDSATRDLPQSNFCLSLDLKRTGRIETRAKTPRATMDATEMVLSFEDISWRVVPALMNTNDGGATPEREEDSLVKHFID